MDFPIYPSPAYLGPRSLDFWKISDPLLLRTPVYWALKIKSFLLQGGIIWTDQNPVPLIACGNLGYFLKRPPFSENLSFSLRHETKKREKIMRPETACEKKMKIIRLTDQRQLQFDLVLALEEKRNMGCFILIEKKTTFTWFCRMIIF